MNLGLNIIDAPHEAEQGDADHGRTLLDLLIQERGVTPHWLATESGALYREFRVAKSTIRNWQQGTVKTAQDWRSVAIIGQLLDLTLPQADQLLASLGCMTISHRAKFPLNPVDAGIIRWWMS